MNILSKSQEEFLKESLNDGDVSIAEYEALRDLADDKFVRLAEELGEHNSVTAFQKSADLTVQLLHDNIVNIQNSELTGLGNAICKDAIIAQVNYINFAATLYLKSI